nr:piwi-like protein Ago3 [Leptinotarsa decemlineata]
MDRPPPKGRGAAMLALMKKRGQEKAVGVQPEESPPAEPPKPRGRAALLQKLQESKLKKVGADTSSSVVASTSLIQEAPITATKATAPVSASSPKETSVAKSVEELSRATSEISLTEQDPVFYKGEGGKQIKVSANYIKLHLEKDCGVYEYEVRFNPDIDAKNRRIRAVNQIKQKLGPAKVFDGGSVLYLPQKITDTVQSFTTSIPGPDGDLEIGLTIIYKRKKNLADRECLHLYNVLFKRIMYSLMYTQMGRNYFNTEHKHLIPQHKLEVYPGFAVSVDELEDGLMLCLDTQHRVMRTQNAYELLTELRISDSNRFKEVANSNLIGSCIFTKYNNKTYIIDDVAWDMTPRDTFPTRDGRNITFIEYYKTQHNIVIRDETQPLLINRRDVKVSGSSEKVNNHGAFIAINLFVEILNKSFKVMKDVAQYTRVTPNQRLAALRTYMDNVRKSEAAQQILGNWGLKLADTPLTLQARQLENETIYFGRNQCIQTNNNADWNRAVGEQQVALPVDMHTWILFYTGRDEKYAKDFSQTIVRLGSVMGCRINAPKPVKLQDDRTDTYIRACQENIDENIQIVVFICPTMRSDRYAVIKKICCTQIPVASQVINSKTLSNPQKVRSIIQKIALQMTCKLGGTLWTVRFPFKGWAICGIDVYHGSPGNSVCGFVGSLNESISRWYSTAIFQERELSDFYKIAFTKYLEKYRNANGFFPSKIVIIRDGVGDGQLAHCKRYEIEQLESVLKQFQLETKLCFIIVQKRINTRIFNFGRDGCENPPPGTVLDHTVTRRYLHDFFLVPQNVRQGTVNPTHYIVLYDTCNLKPDHSQRLCYKLCHLYYNWPGTIRVPAPCQYAHKLAALVGQHIKKAPSAVLSDTLFYL